MFAFIVTATLPPPSSRSSQVIIWLIVSLTSTGVLILVDGLARRLLPLAALLSLSMVFPDRAPSRFKVARRAGGQRNLEARLEEARRMGEEDTAPAKAAETIIELVNRAAAPSPRRLAAGDRPSPARLAGGAVRPAIPGFASRQGRPAQLEHADYNVAVVANELVKLTWPELWSLAGQPEQARTRPGVADLP